MHQLFDEATFDNMATYHPTFWNEEFSMDICNHSHLEETRCEGVQKYIKDFETNAEADFNKQQKEIFEKDNQDYLQWVTRLDPKRQEQDLTFFTYEAWKRLETDLGIIPHAVHMYAGNVFTEGHKIPELP